MYNMLKPTLLIDNLISRDDHKIDFEITYHNGIIFYLYIILLNDEYFSLKNLSIKNKSCIDVFISFFSKKKYTNLIRWIKINVKLPDELKIYVSLLSAESNKLWITPKDYKTYYWMILN